MKQLLSILAVLCVFAFVSQSKSLAETQQTSAGNIVVAAQTYKSRWDQVGGSWTTGWVRNHPKRICGAGAHCQCNGKNFCGTYQSGQYTYWWPKGCHKKPMKLRCTSVPE